METLVLFFAGFVATFLGGLVPGAVNLNVVYTTIHKGPKASTPIILAAGLGEIILSFVALNFGMFVEEHIQNNKEIELAIALAFLIVGLVLWFQKKPEKASKPKRSFGFLKGFLLSTFNPPVLVFWLIAFAVLTSFTAILQVMAVLYMALAFFAGIYLGKAVVLFGYQRLSVFIVAKIGAVQHIFRQLIAVVLLVIGTVQMVRVFW